MKLTGDIELAYCTNIHPAETWEETWTALKVHTLEVRNQLREQGLLSSEKPFAIGLRLSAQAAQELEEQLISFRVWLAEENCYVFTINGFPYGAFHDTRVKEKVYQPDWCAPSRLEYTKSMARIISALNPAGASLSISTLPGSFKSFKAYEHAILCNLVEIAEYLERLSQNNSQNLHLGLEPEPLGHFEDLAETVAFFERLWAFAPDKVDLLKRRIGVNYDTCHFALEYEDCHDALSTLNQKGIFISKVHLSNALTFDPQSPQALAKLHEFDEPTYLHQVLCLRPDGKIDRFTDIPEFYNWLETHENDYLEGRCHFHIPLYDQPTEHFGTTLKHAADALSYLNKSPFYCSHFEIETYTWKVLPDHLQKPIESMICSEYEWVLARVSAEESA